VKAFFAGAEPVVVVLLVLAAWSMGKHALRRPQEWMFGIISFGAVFFLGVNPIFAIIAGAGLGLLLFRE
jgi:chromate transport protein ChrA